MSTSCLDGEKLQQSGAISANWTLRYIHTVTMEDIARHFTEDGVPSRMDQLLSLPLAQC